METGPNPWMENLLWLFSWGEDSSERGDYQNPRFEIVQGLSERDNNSGIDIN